MITIIIPCKNRIEKLFECLDSIKYSIEKARKEVNNLKSEILVVNDHSEEGFSEKIKEKYNDIKVLNSVKFGPGAARNYGISQSNGEYIFFTDSDCIVDENWIINGYRSFKDTNSIVIQGNPWLFQKRDNKYLGNNEEKLYELMFSTYLDGEYSTMTDSRNLLMDKKIIKILGDEVFSEKIDRATAESRVFGKKCINEGLKILFDRNIKVYHEDSLNMISVCKQKYRHGNGRVLIWDKTPEYDFLEFRYYENPINNGIDKDYILPAHTAFLLGYFQNINDPVEFDRFMNFIEKVFKKYDRKIEDYKEIMELMSNG